MAAMMRGGSLPVGRLSPRRLVVLGSSKPVSAGVGVGVAALVVDWAVVVGAAVV